jgi:hypothetical protein
MANIKRFDFQGHSITFEFSDGCKMIHANQMVKPFGKRLDNFFRLKETKDYILLLEARYENIPGREVLRTVKGGNKDLQGTWVDEKLALKLAMWLSPSFELWVHDRIYELLTTGKTELPNHTPSATGIIKGLRLIVQQLEEQDQINQEVQQQLAINSDRIDEVEAKLLSIDESYYSISGYCALNGVDCPLNKAQSWGLAATKLSAFNNVSTGKAYDAKYGEINTYHVDILKQIIK